MTQELWYQVIYTVLSVAGALVTYWLNKYLSAKFTAEQIQTGKVIATQAVYYVEQVFKAIHGEEKLDKALDAAKAFAASKGINFTDAQWKTLIEASVKDMNAWLKPVTDGDKASE